VSLLQRDLESQGVDLGLPQASPAAS
jgi:hypothetical protein